MQSLGRKRTKNAGCQVTHYLNCPVLPKQGDNKISAKPDICVTEKSIRTVTGIILYQLINSLPHHWKRMSLLQHLRSEKLKSRRTTKWCDV